MFPLLKSLLIKEIEQTLVMMPHEKSCGITLIAFDGGISEWAFHE